MITVEGVVADKNTKEPLIGVTVSEKGTTNGTMSDVDGNFTLKAKQGAVLVFTSIGYKPVEHPASSKMNVVMEEDSKTLDDVVVVGYGVQKKVNLTGAVAAVDGKDISARATTDVLSALQGQMPGVTVLRSSGQPGSETSGMRIRGFSSVNGVNALVLIDGIEGDLKMLNSEDIESVSVLKDAAAASIYGSRAAGGVILVTTKKSVSQKPKISYNGSFGINLPGYMPQRMSPWEEQDYINQARNADRGVPEQNPEQTSWVGNPNFNYYPNGARWTFHGNTNWLDEGTNDYTTQTTHSVAVNGGQGKTNYYVSMGYYTKNGMLKYNSDDYSRYNLRATLSTEVSKYLDVKLLVSYERGVTNQNPVGSTTILSHLYNDRGRQAIYLPEEDTNYTNNPYSADLQMNVIDAMKNGGKTTGENQYFTGNANLHVKNLVKGLTLDLNLSRKAGFYSYEGDYSYRPSMGRNGAFRAGYDINNPNRVVKTKNNSYQDKLETLLNYNATFDKHSLHILAGASYEQYLKDEISGTARNLLSNDFFSFGYYDSTIAGNAVLSDAISPWKMGSFFGRVNYDFAGRYLFEANIRYDGSSRLDPDKRWGAFPSFSAGWRVSEESFFESMRKYVDNLKLRGSWGQLGNSTIFDGRYYSYLGIISNKTDDSDTNILSVMGNPVYHQKDMVSKGITWEIVTSTNLGIDLTILRNRLNLTADYYWKTNDNMLSRPRPGNIVGYPATRLAYQNVGTLKTHGWEVTAQWRDKIGEVSYNVGFNIDDSQNKVISYTGSTVISNGTVDILEGYPLNTIWGYKTDGFWNSREEYLAYKAANPGYESFNDAKVSGGDTRYVAQGKADHTIGVGGATVDNPGDLVYMGTTNGRYNYGINIGVEWKGFDFSCFFQGVGKRNFVVNSATLAPLGNSYEMPWTVNLDYWTEDNKDAYFARPYEGNSFNYNPADRWVQNGAYIRLKNIQLGYKVPIPAKIASLRVYVNGTDVWEHTNALKVFDPEVGNNKNTQYYPFFRTWTMGVNVTF
ncbi:SusC/RagA family TonB-linked outer membrane protein [Bacteroidia bacterium]|nr:SusC/RagA family TonB-linked outer membrane protein [Bacteroidia bacterium]